MWMKSDLLTLQLLDKSVARIQNIMPYIIFIALPPKWNHTFKSRVQLGARTHLSVYNTTTRISTHYINSQRPNVAAQVAGEFKTVAEKQVY